MKNLRLTIFIGLLQFCPAAFSQTITVSGKVVDKDTGKPVEKAIVSLKQTSSNRIIAFSQTSGGVFEIKKEFNPAACKLEISCLGYAVQTCSIPVGNQPMLIELARKDFQLKEVVISPQKIMQRKDTITYIVSSFSSAEDRTIGDVLKKMPGVEVLESGEIKYQGQSLNKFYIEGSDMLGGRYGLATNNISHKDVARVDIMENHQPVKALEDVVYTGSPAMNIKLKEDAKSRWAGTMKGGAGVPGLWTAEAFTMRFKVKTQSLNTYKGNNTGNESYEMNVFLPTGDLGANFTNQLSSYIQVAPSLAGDIGSSRSTFNQTNNFTTNNLHKVGKDFDLISEFTGTLDRRESEYVSQTTYFLGGEQVLVEDKTENANDFKKAMTGKIQLKSNQPTYYLNNYLNFNYDRNDPSMDISGSYPNRQKASIENLKVSNNFDMLRRKGDRFFTFRSSNEYTSKPQLLEVTRTGLPPSRENIGLSSFRSNNSSEYSFMIGKIRLRSPINLLYQYKQIENELNGEANSLETNKVRLDATPSFDYNINDFHFSLSGNLFYHVLLLENKAHHLYGVNPSLSLNWIASAFLTLRANASYSNDLPDENLFYYGAILNNYRSLTSGYIDFSKGKSVNLSTGMEYKDVIKTLFADLRIGLSQKQYTKIPGQYFEGDSIINYYFSGNRTTTMLFLSGSLSKGIGLIHGTASVYPFFVRSKSSILRNDITIPYTSDSYTVRGRVNSSAVSRCNLTYEVSYGYSKQAMESNRQYFSSLRFSESLKVTYIPVKSLQISYKFDHYCNELASNEYKNFIFSDVSISFLPGNRWELSCSVKNIFDERHYSYFIENELTSYYQSYKIRPRNVLVSATYRF